MPVLTKFVVFDSDVDFPEAALRFVRLRFPLSDEDTVCFKPTLAQVRIVPQFLRLVKEMEMAGVKLPAGLFMVDPPSEWLNNEANFVKYGDDEELLRPVHEQHDRLSNGCSFRHSTFKKKSMKLGQFRADAARVSDPAKAGDTYEQDAIEEPPFTTRFFDEYFRRNGLLLARFDSTFRLPKVQRERLLDASNQLLEPPCYAANIEGSLMSDKCQVLNFNCLGTALDFVRPLYPGVSTPYVYFSQKGTMACWHAESMSLMSMLYLAQDSSPKIWYSCTDKEGFEKLAKELYPEFAEKCDQHVSHLECCIAPELVRKAGLPLSVCIQAPGSFVVTRYNTMYMVWNTGYSEATAVNLVDDDYREVAVDVLERRLYCLCDTLPQLDGQFEEGDDLDEFHDIAVRRVGMKAFSLRIPRRREVVRFNLHYFREAWRAVDERRELLAAVSDLRSQLGASSASVASPSAACSSVASSVGVKVASLVPGSANTVSPIGSSADSGTTGQSSVGLRFGMSRELHPAKAKKLAFSLTSRVASGGSLAVDSFVARRSPAVASAATASATSESMSNLPSDSQSSVAPPVQPLVAPSASRRVPNLSLTVFFDKASLSATADSARPYAHRYFVVPSRVPDSQELSTLAPVLELPYLRWSDVISRPPLCAGSVPSRGGGKVDFGSDGDSVVSDGGRDSDVVVESQKGESSLPRRILRKRPVVASSGSSASSRTSSSDAALSRTPSPDASGKYLCVYCKRRDFSTKKVLRRHQMHSKVCTDSPRRKAPIHECPDCDVKYSMKYELKRHRKTHQVDVAAGAKKSKPGRDVTAKKVKSEKKVDGKKAKPVEEVASSNDPSPVQLPSTSREDFL